MRKSAKKRAERSARAVAEGRGMSARRKTSARARFDNVSHPGRRSPVREALRLPEEPDGGNRQGAGGSKTAGSLASAAAASSRPGESVTRGALAGTGPLTKWPRPEEEPSEPKRPPAGQTGKRTVTAVRQAQAAAVSLKGRTATGKLDPWSDDEPLFGQREVTHALSPTPGTPPHGNLAVFLLEPPAPGRTSDSVRGGRAASPAKPAKGVLRTTARRGGTKAVRRAVPATIAGVLSCLRKPIRVELELEHCGRWACGLSEKASPRGLEISLGHRGVGTRDFLSAGRRVRLLVSPHRGRPFQLQTKILWVDPPSGPHRAVRAQLAIVTKDPGALARWQGLVEKSRG